MPSINNVLQTNKTNTASEVTPDTSTEVTARTINSINSAVKSILSEIGSAALNNENIYSTNGTLVNPAFGARAVKNASASAFFDEATSDGVIYVFGKPADKLPYRLETNIPFCFLVPDTNVTTAIQFNVNGGTGVNYGTYPIYKSDGTSTFEVGEFKAGYYAICVFDQNLNATAGGYRCILIDPQTKDFATNQEALEGLLSNKVISPATLKHTLEQTATPSAVNLFKNGAFNAEIGTQYDVVQNFTNNAAYARLPFVSGRSFTGSIDKEPVSLAEKIGPLKIKADYWFVWTLTSNISSSSCIGLHFDKAYLVNSQTIKVSFVIESSVAMALNFLKARLVDVEDGANVGAEIDIQVFDDNGDEVQVNSTPRRVFAELECPANITSTKQLALRLRFGGSMAATIVRGTEVFFHTEEADVAFPYISRAEANLFAAEEVQVLYAENNVMGEGLINPTTNNYYVFHKLPVLMKKIPTATLIGGFGSILSPGGLTITGHGVTGINPAGGYSDFGTSGSPTKNQVAFWRPATSGYLLFDGRFGVVPAV